jgi:3-oxoacyl-[acyl-carrier protein] reductase
MEGATIQHKEKKVAVISGFTGYVGLAIAKALAEKGICIVGLYHNTSEKDAKALLVTLEGEGHVLYRCTLDDEVEMEKLLRTIKEQVGDPQFCIHAAWSKPDRRQLLNTTKNDVVDHLKVNLGNSFVFLSTFARYFKEQNNGVLIGITTSGVIVSQDTKALGGYILAKYALQGMLTSLKEELGTTNVRVYSVAPSFMEEGMNKDIPKAFIEILKVNNKVQKFVNATDVANIVSRLCTDSAPKENNFTFLVTPDPRAD